MEKKMPNENMIQTVVNRIQNGRKVDANSILQRTGLNPKATHAEAVNKLMNAIVTVAENGENHPESRKAAIDAIGTIRNSDSMDIIQNISDTTRRQLENEHGDDAENVIEPEI